jgi:hypothetical protein
MKDNFKFFLSVIPQDFSVELLVQNSNDALFYALEKHVWYFVYVYQEKDDRIHIRHFIIPRFLMASTVNTILSIDKTWRPIVAEILNGINLIILPNERFDFELVSTKNGLPNVFCELLKKDVDIYTKSLEKIKQVDDIYTLPRAKTPNGSPVTSTHQTLIHAISFERMLIGKLQSEKFGIFSAFCTFCDFPLNDIILEDDFLKELILSELKHSPKNTNDQLRTVFINVQNKLLSKPIWGEGIDVDIKEAIVILKEGLSIFSLSQFTQFALMNGMHNAGLFLPLAVITQTISNDEYIDLASWYAIGTEEDKSMRIETAYIQLFNTITKSD